MILVVDASVAVKWFFQIRSDEEWRSMRLSFRDAMIIEAALSGGAKSLFTEDLQHDQVVEGMRLLNPFFD